MHGSNQIAVLSAVHRRPDLVAEQVKNYYHHHGDAAFHILHPSIPGRTIVAELDERLQRIKSHVYIAPKSAMTGWYTIMGAFLSCTEYLTELGISNVNKIYMHSDGDLLVRDGFLRRVTGEEAAFSADPVANWWWWYNKMTACRRFAALREHMGISDECIVWGRQEGAFFPTDVWLEATSIISRFYDSSFFDAPTDHWPIEECVLPTIVMKIRPTIKRGKIPIRTKEWKHQPPNVNPRDVEENCVNLQDIAELKSEQSGDILGMKWFSQRIENEARDYLRNEQLPSA